MDSSRSKWSSKRSRTSLSGAGAGARGRPVPHWDGLEQAGAEVYDQVLAPLARGGRAAYRRWDWGHDRHGQWPGLLATNLLLVEELGSGAGPGTQLESALIWLEANPEVRRRRGMPSRICLTGDAGPPASRPCSTATGRASAQTSSSTPHQVRWLGMMGHMEPADTMAVVTASMQKQTDHTLDERVALVRRTGLDPLQQKDVRRLLRDVHGVAQNPQWTIADASARRSGWASRPSRTTQTGCMQVRRLPSAPCMTVSSPSLSAQHAGSTSTPTPMRTTCVLWSPYSVRPQNG
jgi:hypothetical protein